MSQRQEHIEEFYDLLNALSLKVGGSRILLNCNGKMGWPSHGVYFFFEQGETRSHKSDLRVVRVGTHAVSTGSKTILWNRLRTHRGSGSGGGNHRGSIFRLHVGVALLNRDNNSNFSDWGKGSSASKAIKQADAEHERRVSEYIGSMPFLWVKIADEPSKNSNRALIERNAIALLAGEDGQSPLDIPSSSWLGQHSDRTKIRLSGLWNLNHVGEANNQIQYNPEFLSLLRTYIEAM